MESPQRPTDILAGTALTNEKLQDDKNGIVFNHNNNNNNNNIKQNHINGHLYADIKKECDTNTKDGLSPLMGRQMVTKDEKALDEDEEMDEPDAMSTDKQQHLNRLAKEEEGNRQYNGYSDSGDEDMDEDDRLVIDDQEGRSLSKSGNGMEQVFSCPQCHVVTTSAKAYLYHLDNVHNVKESGKRLQLLASEEDDRASSNKTPDSFMNLSIPLNSSQASSALKDEDMEDEDEEEGSMNTSSFSITPKTFGSCIPQGITTDNIDQIFDDDKKKKKKTRQEVDPGKYFEAVDSSGTKYACSQCGNIYKWRKSLNKHWKEKHLNDPLAEVASPPGMLELLKSGKYTQLGSRRIYDNNFLQTIKAQKDDDLSRTSTPNSEIKSSTPNNLGDTPLALSSSANTLGMSMPTTLLPKMIGPFVANTAQPVFPGMGMALQHMVALQNGYDSTSDEGAMDLTRAGKALGFAKFLAARDAEMNNASLEQDQPLDFSKKKGGDLHVKRENGYENGSTDFMGMRPEVGQIMTKIHRCSKCDYTSTSEVDFANHTGSHYSKRVCKCFECKVQFNSMEELNSHYVRDHAKKLTEYKEAIKKIPHGLQQTYHLLNMDLQSIGELNNQDLGSSETKSLKCKKCDFEAKWPAELQKHAVSHSEERPYICMVCGSTYKWKWDLVKHFQKSHPALPNPYRRNDKRETPDVSSEEEADDEPDIKRAKMSALSANMNSGSPYSSDDMISVKGIIEATQAGQRLVSSQPTLFDEDSSIEGSLALMQSYPYAAAAAAVASVPQASLAQEIMDRHAKAQKAIQEAIKSRQTTPIAKSPSALQDQSESSSPVPGSGKAEQLPYKCTMCNYHARWPSEVTQHMKNHSDCKPYLCPRCDYRSKWKWDVVKHLKRCGGGTINDVIDITKVKKKDTSPVNSTTTAISGGPPNAVVSQLGKVKKTTPQPLSFILPSVDANGQQSALVVKSTSHDQLLPSSSHTHIVIPDRELESDANPSDRKPMDNRLLTPSSDTIDLTINNNNDNNNDNETMNNNINNNYASYCDGQPTVPSNATSTSLLASPTPRNEPTTNATSSSSPPSVPTTPSSSATTSHRQNSSAEVWECPHCPFSTLSQAELKRHSGLHMDDKPFKCNECHYSTRWACDLKKHRKSYDHYPKNNNNNSNLINKNSKEAGVVNKTVTKAKNNKEDGNVKPENKGRFKCFQCSVFFHNLQSLIDHRKLSHSPNESSPTPQTASPNEIDAARIKHPRKQIKQFTCPKCPFICKNRQTMDNHIEEHEQMERDAFLCFYCNSQYKDKEALLDHIVTHPSFNAKEWETFFMITEEEEQQEGDEEMEQEPNKSETPAATSSSPANSKSPVFNKTEQSKIDAEAATQARIQQILDDIPKQKSAQQQQQQHLPPQQHSHQQSQHHQQQQNATTFNKFKCEWCPAEFINLTAVYKHASTAHPMQLKEQDVTMSLAYAGLHAKNQEAQKTNSRTDVPTGEALQMLRQQIAEKRNHQLAEKFNHMVSSNPKLQEVLNKRLEEENMKRFQSDKGPIAMTNAASLKNQPEQLYEGKGSTECWFCDYSVGRMDLLYQHMKISHTRKWKALSQNPKYANHIQRMNLAFANSDTSSTPVHEATGFNDTPLHFNSNNDTGVMDLSSKKSDSEVGHDIVYIRKPQYTWSGIPVNVIPEGSALSFVCPKCSFNDASIAKTCAHVMQSHRAMSKFNCTRCQFSDDNIHVMSDHCKTCHPVQERIVEVLDFKQLNFTELQMVQLSAMKEKMSQDLCHDMKPDNLSPAKAHDPVPNNSSPGKPLSCPFCPFKTYQKEAMKQHIGNHSQNSRFSCQSCDFSSDSPAIIQEHVKVHEINYGESGRIMANNQTKVKEERGMNLSQVEVLTSPSADLQIAENHGPLSSSSERVKASSPKVKTPGRIRYRCSICPYHTTCKSNIFKHKRQHVIPKRYKCTKCTYTAARAVLLKKHIESHDVPIGDEDGYYHDVFYDPYSTSDKAEDNDEVGENEEVEAEEASEEDSTSDDLDNEINSKAIADLEAKDILEAEAAHKASTLQMEEIDAAGDKTLRKQKCTHCPFSSNSAYEFRKHLNFHGTQERYKCDLCSYSIDRFNLLTQHRKLHLNEPGYSSNPVPSNLLNTRFILQQSEVMAGSAQPELEDFNSIPDTLSEPSSSQHCCVLCPYKSSYRKAFEIHSQSHRQRRRFICDYCDWSADQISVLHQHRQVHRDEPNYTASPVESIFLNQEFDDGASGEFEAKSMEIPNNDNPVRDDKSQGHTNSPPFKLTLTKKSYPCKLCPYKTNFKNNYHIHKSMHSSEGEFSCSECSFSAISRGLLQQHQLLHSSSSTSSALLSPPNLSSPTRHDSLNPSSICNAKFSNSSTQSELNCQRCPFTATSPASLCEHLKAHSSCQDKLTCPFCDFKASAVQSMYPHIQLHFPGTKLENDAMAKMLEEHAAKNAGDNNLHNNNNINESSPITTKPAASSSSGPDGHVIKTKIYVCQYCEREFEAKSQMIQHEKQHLASSH